MKRRTFVATLALVSSALSLSTHAQRAGKMWRIGYLMPTDIPRATLTDALRELGYVDGDTMRLEVRSAQNDLDRLPQLALALVQGSVDVIVAVSPPAIKTASRVTKTTPIVMGFWGGEGLIESGIVTSFARPGTNVTGIYMLAAEMDAKRLELHLDAIPNEAPVRRFIWPRTPLGAALFRVRSGSFVASDISNGAFAQFADAPLGGK